MLAGHLSTETRFTEGFVCTQKLVEGRPLARRRKRAEIRAQEDARDVTGSDNAPPRIACTHTHNGLPRIQDDGDDAIPSACPRALGRLSSPPPPPPPLDQVPRLNALRYESSPIPPVFPTELRERENHLFISSSSFFLLLFFFRSLEN